MKRIVYLVLVLLWACGKDDPKIPEAAILVFPAQNSVCITGVEVSPTTSRVEFRWQAAVNADTYQVEVTNLNSNSTQVGATSATALPIVLQNGQPYSWKVISKNNESNELATSQTWLFYNAGTQTTYAPFPAQIIAPISGGTVQLDGNGQVLLRWSGADVDSDIDSFEVFLDTADPPSMSQGTLNFNVQELAVSLDPATVYYWKVITTDREGNRSDSGTYSFRTQ